MASQARKTTAKAGQLESSNHVLHRNKACLSCRARKTKCDAAKPSCSTCKRLGTRQESQCRYDEPPKWLESVLQPRHQMQCGSDDARPDTGPTPALTQLQLQAKLGQLERKLADLCVHLPASLQSLFSAASSSSSSSSLLESHWPFHLPLRTSLKHLCQTVFTRPLSPFTLIDPAPLLSQLELHPTHPSFPDLGLLHALSAIGAHHISSLNPQSGLDPEYHADWASRLLSAKLSQSNDNTFTKKSLIQVAEGGMMLSQYYSMIGRPLVLWKWLGFSIRICALLGFNSSPQQDPEEEQQDAMGVSLWDDGVLDSVHCGSQVEIDGFQSKLMWWYLYCCERVCAGAAGFAKTIAEEDCNLEMMSSSFNDHSVRDGTQVLSHPSFFFVHDLAGGGALHLLLKASCLLGKVTSFGYRTAHPCLTWIESEIERSTLSILIDAFFASIPARLKNPFESVNNYGIFDFCLLSAHATAHSCIIELNEPFVKSVNLQDPCFIQCLRSSRVLIDWFKKVDVDFPQVDFGVMLCCNSSLNFSLTVALRTQCRLVGFYEALGFPEEANEMRAEVLSILKRLEKSTSLPMAGKSLVLINELLVHPVVLLPRFNWIQGNRMVKDSSPKRAPPARFTLMAAL